MNKAKNYTPDKLDKKITLDLLLFLLEKTDENADIYKEFCEKILYDKKQSLSKVDRVELAIKLKDYAYIKEALKEPFNAVDLVNLLNICTDLKIFEKFLLANAPHLEPSNMEYIMEVTRIKETAIKTADSIKNSIAKNGEASENTEDSEDAKIKTQKKYNREYVKATQRYVKKFKGRVKLSIINDMILTSGNPELIENWKKQCISIESVKDLSIEQIEKQRNIKYIRITKKNSPVYYYSRDEYIKIRSSIDTILSKVGLPKKGDFDSELNAFCEIFKLLSYISYDYDAIKDTNINNWKMQERAGDLYGGLIDGKTVCRGYAHILQQIFDMSGIESNIIIGEYGTRKWARILEKILGFVNIDCKTITDIANGYKAGHAWNQVKIGGNWYNVDMTNYINYAIKNNGKNVWKVLKSDSQFKRRIYKYREISEREKCKTKITSEIYKRNLGDSLKTLAIRNKHTILNMQDEINKLAYIIQKDKDNDKNSIRDVDTEKNSANRKESKNNTTKKGKDNDRD